MKKGKKTYSYVDVILAISVKNSQARINIFFFFEKILAGFEKLFSSQTWRSSLVRGFEKTNHYGPGKTWKFNEIESKTRNDLSCMPSFHLIQILLTLSISRFCVENLLTTIPSGKKKKKRRKRKVKRMR